MSPPPDPRRGLRAGLTGLALAFSFAVLLTPPPARACRYSVRDTGFVDLEQLPWRLRLSGFDAARESAWRKAAESQFLDANLRLESAAAPAETGPAAPIIALVAPDDRVLPLAPPEAVPAQLAGIAEFLDRLALSRARDRVHEDLLHSFAVVLLIEGTDRDRTTAARRAAEDAIRAFTPRLRSLPKPVETPPRLVALAPDDLPAERILVWSVGCVPEPRPEPRAVVLFGRGRRLGEPLDGPLITRTTIEERFSLIGQDCECDLDRAWLQGTVFPARWDLARQSAAARLLGFDPENPLVRSEVSRIVLRGPAAGTTRRNTAPAADAFALGYREDSVDADPPATGSDVATNAVPATDRSAAEPAGPAGETRNPRSAAPADAGVESPDHETAGPSRLPWILLLAAVPVTLLAGIVILLKAARAR